MKHPLFAAKRAFRLWLPDQFENSCCCFIFYFDMAATRLQCKNNIEIQARNEFFESLFKPHRTPQDIACNQTLIAKLQRPALQIQISQTKSNLLRLKGDSLTNIILMCISAYQNFQVFLDICLRIYSYLNEKIYQMKPIHWYCVQYALYNLSSNMSLNFNSQGSFSIPKNMIFFKQVNARN